MIIGIDPGVNGAVVVLDRNGSGTLEPVGAWDIPTTQAGKRREVSGTLLARSLRNTNLVGGLRDARVVLENVHSMPRDGGVAAFAFGQSVGTIRGVIETLSLPYERVTPQAWQKYFGLRLVGMKGAQRNELIRAEALRRLPSASKFLKLKKDCHKAAALLIALWGVERRAV